MDEHFPVPDSDDDVMNDPAYEDHVMDDDVQVKECDQWIWNLALSKAKVPIRQIYINQG